MGQLVADVPSGFSLTPPQERKKKKPQTKDEWQAFVVVVMTSGLDK
jgi:hypothetical protein